ncbi:MAG: hypothetical protein RIC55_28330 [Pirellulaceae bacterium]
MATAEQIRQLQEGNDGVELVDETGRVLGIVAREIDLEDIRLARGRLASEQPRLSYADVLEHLQRLASP